MICVTKSNRENELNSGQTCGATGRVGGGILDNDNTDKVVESFFSNEDNVNNFLEALGGIDEATFGTGLPGRGHAKNNIFWDIFFIGLLCYVECRVCSFSSNLIYNPLDFKSTPRGCPGPNFRVSIPRLIPKESSLQDKDRDWFMYEQPDRV